MKVYMKQLRKQSTKTSGNCPISYCEGAWHYRIFLDFFNFGFKMASKTEGRGRLLQKVNMLQHGTVVLLL